MRSGSIRSVFIFVFVLILTAMAAGADDVTAAAKASQNPLAKMVSIPIQANVNFGVGPDDGAQWINLIQPVYPHAVGSKLNLIHRLIMPIPVFQPFGGGTWGIGDFQYQGFFSPANPGAVVWGAGPILSFPTASDPLLGSGKWNIGPALIVLFMPGQWVLGGLVTQLWSFAGDSLRSQVSTMSIQYFINYNIPNSRGWYLATGPTMTVNWNAADGEKWTVPVGGGVGKMTLLKGFGLDIKAQVFWFAASPTNGPDWGFQIQGKVVFPK